MKYLSLVILLALLIWTWSLTTTARSFSVEQHEQVAVGVEQDIASFIQRKYPETTEVYCNSLYTEVTGKEGELIAHFRCKANGPMSGGEVTEQTFEGHLNLKSEDGFKTWSETGGQIRSPEISFQNGIQVTPEKAGAPAAEPAPQEGHE